MKGLKLNAGKKKVTVTNKKVSGATSYKVTYSTSKKFKKAITSFIRAPRRMPRICKLSEMPRYILRHFAFSSVKLLLQLTVKIRDTAYHKCVGISFLSFIKC